MLTYGGLFCSLSFPSNRENILVRVAFKAHTKPSPLSSKEPKSKLQGQIRVKSYFDMSIIQ